MADLEEILGPRERAILEHLPDAVLAVSRGGQIAWANAPALTMFGYRLRELVGIRTEMLIPSRLRQVHQGHCEGYSANPTVRPMGIGMELWGLRKNGAEFPAEISLAPLTGPPDTLTLVAVRDISDRIDSRRALLEADLRIRMAEQSLADVQDTLQIARRIQMRLFPAAAPAVEGMDIAGATLPAQETGGDYFDYLCVRNDELVLAVGDVAGHGVPAALVTADVHAYLRALTAAQKSVEQVVERLNVLLRGDLGGERFVTLGLAMIDPAARQVRYLGAGHPAGLLLGGDGQVKALLESTGPLLGVFEEFQATVGGPWTLEAGDMLCLLTDGIPEAAGPGGPQGIEAFGMDRLLQTLRANAAQPAEAIVQAVFQAVRDFSAPSPLQDDLTLIVAKCL